MLVNLVITDNNNNFYGVLKVESEFNNLAIRNFFTDIIINEFESEKIFFEDFSGNLSIAIEKLITLLKSKSNKDIIVEFEYENFEKYNVDSIFDTEKEYIKSLNLSKEDLFVLIQCFVDMVSNNLDYRDDNIGESFYNWCEGGDVFYNMFDNDTLTDEQKAIAEKRIGLMRIFCKYANNITDFFLKVYNIIND